MNKTENIYKVTLEYKNGEAYNGTVKAYDSQEAVSKVLEQFQDDNPLKIGVKEIKKGE